MNQNRKKSPTIATRLAVSTSLALRVRTVAVTRPDSFGLVAIEPWKGLPRPLATSMSAKKTTPLTGPESALIHVQADLNPDTGCTSAIIDPSLGGVCAAASTGGRWQGPTASRA